MLAALIPLFDGQMAVRGYSVFAQKQNYLKSPSYSGVARLDGAGNIPGFDIIDSMGMETLSGDLEIFVEANNVSLFADIPHQCHEDHGKIVLLIDKSVEPTDMYIDRLKQLKEMGYKLAIRKLIGADFENYREIIKFMDYILINHHKLDISKARNYFEKVYPNLKICAVEVDTREDFDKLAEDGHYDLYEGEFFRMPVTEGVKEIAPLTTTYIELLNVVNKPDFDLTDAADVIGHDTALVISLLGMVNRMTVNAGVSSVRHAAAMLGQKELKKWINTAITKEMCQDKPSELTRISLLRARFAENLGGVFGLRGDDTAELFLMGLFSVLDKILDMPMEEAITKVKVSKDIQDALLRGEGRLAHVYDFLLAYEDASWQEVSRQMIVLGIEMEPVYDAFKDSLSWYRKLIPA